MNNAVVNVGVQIPLQDPVFKSLGCIYTSFKVVLVIWSTVRVENLSSMQKRRRGLKRMMRNVGVWGNEWPRKHQEETGMDGILATVEELMWPGTNGKQGHTGLWKEEAVKWPNSLSRGDVICWPEQEWRWKWGRSVRKERIHSSCAGNATERWWRKMN